MNKKMIKLDLFMDEERRVYVRDLDEKWYNFYPLGYGIPVSFIIETDEERRVKNEQEEIREKECLHAYRLRRDTEQKKKSWFSKLF